MLQSSPKIKRTATNVTTGTATAAEGFSQTKSKETMKTRRTKSPKVHLLLVITGVCPSYKFLNAEPPKMLLPNHLKPKVACFL